MDHQGIVSRVLKHNDGNHTVRPTNKKIGSNDQKKCQQFHS